MRIGIVLEPFQSEMNTWEASVLRSHDICNLGVIRLGILIAIWECLCNGDICP